MGDPPPSDIELDSIDVTIMRAAQAFQSFGISAGQAAESLTRMFSGFTLNRPYLIADAKPSPLPLRGINLKGDL